LRARILLLSLFCSFTLLTYSQENTYFDTTHITNHLSFQLYTGTIVPHEKPLKPLNKGIVNAFELSYSIIKSDGRTWHQYYNYPEVGISYMLMDLGYREVLGFSHSIFPYIIFPLTKQDKPFSISLRVASGISYITKIYDSFTNPKNIAISSHLNYYASFNFNINYRLSKSLTTNFGINTSHFSNGAIKKPNYGLNIITTSLGINYNFSNNNKFNKNFEIQDIEKIRWLATFCGGIKEAKDPGGPKYGIGSLSIEWSKPFKTFFRYGATFDYMYDGSTLVHFKEDGISYQSHLKASKCGLTVIGEMVLYRLSAFGGLGAYLYNHDKQNKAIYQNIGLRYRLSKFLYSQISLKTHLNVADYLEFGFSYKINSN
jgi:hypothetical protein